MGGGSLKLLYVLLTFLLHLKLAFGFNPSVGDESFKCIEKERQALLDFKKGIVEDYQGSLYWWGE